MAEPIAPIITVTYQSPLTNILATGPFKTLLLTRHPEVKECLEQSERSLESEYPPVNHLRKGGNPGSPC